MGQPYYDYNTDVINMSKTRSNIMNRGSGEFLAPPSLGDTIILANATFDRSSDFTIGSIKNELAINKNLEGYWPCEDGDSHWTIKIRDYSGNRRDLHTVVGVGWQDGVTGKSLWFPERSIARYAYGNAIDASAWTAFTVSFWASKTAAAAGNTRVLCFGTVNTAGINIMTISTTDHFYLSFSRAGNNEQVLDYTDGFSSTLQHYAVTYYHPTQKWIVYKNGEYISSGVLVNTPVMPNEPIVLGNLAGDLLAANTWVGNIDDVRLYSRVADSQEVRFLYNSSRSSKYNFPSYMYAPDNYSYKFTKTIAAGTEAWVVLGDTCNLKKATFINLNAIGSLIRPGKKYTAEAWLYIPSAAGITGAQISWAIKRTTTNGTVWTGDSVRAVNSYNTWQKVIVKSTMGIADSSAFVRLAAVAAVDINAYFYVKNVAVYEA